MDLKALALSSSGSCCSRAAGLAPNMASGRAAAGSRTFVVRAKTTKGGDAGEEGGKKGKGKEQKQSLFGSVADALDFSAVRSAEDAELLEEARAATKGGGKMTREQYGALRRKIGGTYKDFFKSYVEVDGAYVEEGWVDKTCKVCRKETRGQPRQVDRLGRYVHVACLEKEKSSSTNFFAKLFSLN